MDWTPLRDIPDPALVVLCGASGSGKSTLATFWHGQVVSSDALRDLIGAGQDAEDHRDTFDLVHRIVAMRLRRGLRTVVDATNGPRVAPAPAAGAGCGAPGARLRGGVLAAAGDLPGAQRGPERVVPEARCAASTRG